MAANLTRITTTPHMRRQESAAARIRRRAHRTASLASEYRNLRHVVPSLRRQRDVDKVEVVTEAARYIDHLHKKLIERLGLPLDAMPSSLEGELSCRIHSYLRFVTLRNDWPQALRCFRAHLDGWPQG